MSIVVIPDPYTPISASWDQSEKKKMGKGFINIPPNFYKKKCWLGKMWQYKMPFAAIWVLKADYWLFLIGYAVFKLLFCTSHYLCVNSYTLSGTQLLCGENISMFYSYLLLVLSNVRQVIAASPCASPYSNIAFPVSKSQSLITDPSEQVITCLKLGL